jgi:hypothetical protein
MLLSTKRVMVQNAIVLDAEDDQPRSLGHTSNVRSEVAPKCGLAVGAGGDEPELPAVSPGGAGSKEAGDRGASHVLVRGRRRGEPSVVGQQLNYGVDVIGVKGVGEALGEDAFVCIPPR